MKNQKQIIDLIIDCPEKNDIEIYNEAQSEKINIEESILTLKVIGKLKELDKKFLKEIRDSIDLI